MLGLILCGGKSSRMGTDKGLILHNSFTWATTAAKKLASLDIPVVFSINSEQESDYKKSLPAEVLVKDNSTLLIKGPLAGLLSSHLLKPTEDIFVFACDLLQMQTHLLQELLLASLNQPGFGAYLFKNENEYEPLCGIYKAAALAGIYTLYQQNSLSRHSMKFALEHLRVFSIPVKEHNLIFFKNFNSHADRNGL
jgi:molybdenum cofactor guanylyltransferase